MAKKNQLSKDGKEMSEKDSVILTGGCLCFLDSGCGEDCPYHDGKDEDRCPHLSG